MGAVYSTRLYLLCDDEDAVVDRIRKYVEMSRDENNYPDIEITDLKSALRVIFTDSLYKTDETTRTEYYELEEDCCYEADFCASYGWETVMVEMFKSITPLLKDGAELYIWIDNDYDYLVVKNGQCEWVH